MSPPQPSRPDQTTPKLLFILFFIIKGLLGFNLFLFIQNVEKSKQGKPCVYEKLKTIKKNIKKAVPGLQRIDTCIERWIDR